MWSARIRPTARAGRFGRRSLPLWAVVMATLAVVAGCSGSGTRSAGPDSAGPRSAGPAAATGAAPAGQRTVAVTVTADACRSEHASYATGPLTFAIKNTDATAVSEVEVLSEDRILGERENLAPGFSGSFSLDLQPGTYTLYCPGAGTERSAITVTGTATTTGGSSTKALLDQGAQQYAGYVKAQVTTLQESVARLDQAIRSGNPTAARRAYAVARIPYERIEPVAESFPALDPAIDGRADDIPVARLTGFHRIEYGLFTGRPSPREMGALKPISTRLVADVAKLARRIGGLSGFQPAELANGAVGLLDEAAKSKITGEEERYSHIDLLDFSANVEGSEQAFAYLEDGMTKIDPALVATIRAAFARVSAEVGRFKDPGQPSGYELYGRLSPADVRAIAQALQAVAEPLSRVAGKVVAA